MDDLTNIKGIGPATAKKLAAEGLDSLAALAELQPDDARLNAIGSAEETAAWIDQARKLTDAGSTTETSSDASRAKTAEGGAGNPAGPAAGDLGLVKNALTMAQDEFRKIYPALGRALDAWTDKAGSTPPSALRITARHDGFRRAGIAHPAEATDYNPGRFTPDQMEALFSEPELAVEFV